MGGIFVSNAKRPWTSMRLILTETIYPKVSILNQTVRLIIITQQSQPLLTLRLSLGLVVN